MRIAGAMSILALGAGSLAFGQDAPSREQQIVDLQKQVESINAQLRALQATAPAAGQESRLDGAIRNSPVEPLIEPRRLNLSAPGLEGLDIGGLVHLRGDYWGNFDAGGGNNDVLSFGTEAILGFNARVSEKTSVEFSLHYADVWGNDTEHGLGGSPRLTGSADSGADGNITAEHVALHVKDIYGTGVDMTAGRQKVELGAERIIGDDDFRLTRTSFDGFRFDNEMGDGMGRWTMIAVRLADSDNAASHELMPAAGNVVDNADLFGFYYSNPMRDVGTVDAYVFHLEDMNYPGGLGRTRFTTYGARWQSEDLEGLRFEGEGATQFGELGGDRTHNWGFGTYAYHLGAEYAIADVEYLRGVMASYDHATGGGNLSDNFVQLYPSLHGWFGITDFFSWSNIQHWNLGAKFGVGDGDLVASWHWMRRDSSNAGFVGYNAAAGGTGGKDLGQECDLTYSMQCSKSTSVQFGLGYFFAGGGFHDLTGSANDIVYSYFGSTTRF